MARTPSRHVPAPSPRTLVASSTRLSPLAQGRQRRRNMTTPTDGWQREAYRQVRICGEARYAAHFFANSLSRAMLGIGQPGIYDRAKWDSTGPEVDVLAELLSTQRGGGHRILHALGLHLTIAGECYLIGREPDEYDPEHDADDTVWEVVSVLEIDVRGDRWSVLYADGRRIWLTDDDVVIRIWTPRADQRFEADAPFKALLGVLQEVEYLTRHIFTQVRSRLVGGGIMFLPDNLTFAKPPGNVDTGEEPDSSEAEQFMEMLATVGTQAMLEPDEPAYPITVMAPAEVYEKIDQSKLIQFWGEIDDKAMTLRTNAIRRFALGMDLPQEQVLGMSGDGGATGDRNGGANHWTAWQVDESTISRHIEPKLEAICDALTVSYLIPAVPGTTRAVVYDTSRLRLRPDRSRESVELYDRGLLKGEVALRENGFDPAIDGMTAEEHRLWLVSKIAGGSAAPEQVEAALRLLGIPMQTSHSEPADRGVTRAEQVAPELPGPPSLREHPGKPRTPGEGDGSSQPDRNQWASDPVLISACDGLVFRALEKAGNRILNDRRRGKDKNREVAPYAAHTFTLASREHLREAFTFAEQVLDGIADPETVVPVLTDYCEALFKTQTPHSRRNLTEYLLLRSAS